MVTYRPLSATCCSYSISPRRPILAAPAIAAVDLTIYPDLLLFCGRSSLAWLLHALLNTICFKPFKSSCILWQSIASLIASI